MGKAAMTQTQRCLPLAATTNQQLHIDVAQALSVANKRLYRQNRIYRCRLTLRPSYLTGATEGFTGEVYALNNTWTNRKAYAMAMKAWLDAHEDEVAQMKELGVKGIGKWRDFKTKLGATNGYVGPIGPKFDSTANLFVQEALTPAASNFDWDASTVEITTAAGVVQEFGFNWLASSGNNFNIVEQMARVYDVQTTPHEPSPFNTPYDSITADTDDLSDMEFDNLQDHGQLPPYDTEAVDNVLAHVGTLGTRFVDPAQAGNDGFEMSMLDTGWFDAPCGFIILDGGLFSDLANMDLCLEVAYGSYKGVDAPQFVSLTKRGGKWVVR
jgi:hypothetical protein